MQLSTALLHFIYKNEQKQFNSICHGLEKAKESGFCAVDLNLIHIGGEGVDLPFSDWEAHALKIAETADRLGITFSQAHLPFLLGRARPYDAGSEEDEFERKKIMRAIDYAAELGIGWAVLHPYTQYKEIEFDHEASAKLNVEYYGPMVEYAISKNVGIAFENMNDYNRKLGRRFCAVADELIYLLDTFGNDPLIGVCWDFGHANKIYQNQAHGIRKLGERIKVIHVHDNDKTEDSHLPPFLGKTDWKNLLPVLNEIGFKGAFNFEVQSNMAMSEQLRVKELKYLKQIGEELLQYIT